MPETRLQFIFVAAILFAVMSLGLPRSIAQDENSASTSAALDRVRAQMEKRKGENPDGGNNAIVPAQVSRVRFGRGDSGDPIFRNGIPYYDSWTIRAGAARLRLPAYDQWNRIKPRSQFFKSQAQAGEAGDHLAAAMMDKGYINRMRTKYISFFSLVWVPQEHAFKQMTKTTFLEFKTEVQENAVAERKRLVKREDFDDFEDYLNFKFGRDEEVEDFVDGYMIRAIDADDLVMYFATSSFVYKDSRIDVVEPMILTVTYALVKGKLIRLDMKRLYEGEDDVNALINFSQQYILDMRALNSATPKRLRDR